MGVELDTVRLLQLGLIGRAAIARVARLARTDDGGDDARLHVDLAHGVVLHVDHEEIAALRAEAQFVGEVEGRRGGGAAITRVAGLARAGDQRDLAVLVHAPDALAAIFAIPDRAVGTPDHTEGIVHLRRGGRAAVAGVALLTITGEGRDGCGGEGGGRKEQKEAEHGGEGG